MPAGEGLANLWRQDDGFREVLVRAAVTSDDLDGLLSTIGGFQESEKESLQTLKEDLSKSPVRDTTIIRDLGGLNLQNILHRNSSCIEEALTEYQRQYHDIAPGTTVDGVANAAVAAACDGEELTSDAVDVPRTPREDVLRTPPKSRRLDIAITDKYRFPGVRLGQGTTSVVNLVELITDSSMRFACKTIDKVKLRWQELVDRELDLMMKTNHPHICQLVEYFDTESELHLILELYSGGELFERLVEKAESGEQAFSEREAADVTFQMLSAVDHLHTVHNIAHRDLKPENILYKSKTSPHVVLVDLGVAKGGWDIDNLSTVIGSPYYTAPEVRGREYTKACDIWSLGVIVYMLLSGAPPFFGESEIEILEAAAGGKYDFENEDWENVSSEAKDFVAKCLEVDPTKRPTASGAMQHHWFAILQGEETSSRLNTAHIASRLQHFMRHSRLKQLALNIIVRDLDRNQLQMLRGVFDQLSPDENDEIQLSKLQQSFTDVPELQSDITRLLASLDVDGSETISLSEFLAATMDHTELVQEEHILQAFQKLDADGSGEITSSDLMVVTGNENQAREMMQELHISTDSPGITYKQFAWHLKKRGTWSPKTWRKVRQEMK